LHLKVMDSGDNVYTHVECVNGFAFKIAAAGVKCALLPVICAVFGQLRDICAHDCRFERLSPRLCQT